MTDEEKEAFLAGYEAALNDVFECCGCGGKNGQDKAIAEYEQRSNTKVVAVYADAFGCWHAEVETTNNAIASDELTSALARQAILKEIRARHHTDVLHGVELTQQVSRDGTLTHYYREKDTP